MVRMVRNGSALLWLGLMGLGLEACSTDDVGLGTARGPDDLAIDKVETTGIAVTKSGGPLELGCSAPILVWIGPYDRNDDKLGDFTLAPPGDCGTLTNCGWIVLTPNSSDKYATQAIQSPVELNLPTEMRTAGTLTLHVELRDVWGDPVRTGDGKPLSANFEVELPEQNCP
jgi:hypothetical protein